MPALLPVPLVDGSATPLHSQLESYLRVAILGSQLPPRTRLPSIRALAEQLGIARGTVQTAYAQLIAEGYLVAVVGSGTSVAPELPDRSLTIATRPRRRLQAQGGSQLPLVSRKGLLPPGTYLSERPKTGALPFDFRPARPAIDLFPDTLWGRLLRSAWHDLANTTSARLLDYSDPDGLLQLRHALAAHLAASRGVKVSAETLIITSGAQASFDATSRIWFGHGRTCLVEDPGYPMAWRTLQATGTRLLPVDVDDRGAVVAALPHADGLVVTPSWQYPAGGTLPLARRLELLQWAERRQALILEDDYDSELRYEGRPLPSLQGIDTGSRVLYVGTFSKIAFPGLRLGYAIVPAALRNQFLATLELSHRGASIVEQLALARFIGDGHLDRHLRRIRLRYAERQALLLARIRHDCAPWLQAQPFPAGMHIVAKLEHTRVTASGVAAAAARVGVGLTTMKSKRMRAAPDRELLIGYAGLKPTEIEEGISRLAGVLARLQRRPRRGDWPVS